MKAVREQTRNIAIGVLIGDALMILVFFLLKKLHWTVFTGAALGSAAAVWNFYTMGKTVQKALKDAETAQLKVRRSYSIRTFTLVGVLAVGMIVDWFDPFAVAIPLLFPGLTIHAMRLLGFYKPQEEE